MNSELIINPKESIKDALEIMAKVGEKCLVVLNEDGNLLGTLSGGDLRKSILSGSKLTSSIRKSYFKNPTFLFKDSYKEEQVKNIFLENRFDIIPVVDKKHKLVNILEWSNFFDTKPLDQYDFSYTPVVIMAGGKGVRLQPFTSVLPKPLIPVDDKPIIEHIIEKFTDVGCKNFSLTINYKGNIMKAYFDELAPDYNVSFIDEVNPLGTAGSLRFLKGRLKQSFFVTNCDIVVKTDYTSLMETHIKNNNDITLVASAKEYIIPYGTCELNNDGGLSHINEKPKYDFLINTGLYILNPDILKLIPKNKFYHITHLIEDAKNIGKKVGIYPIDDTSWFDVGEWAEYKKTVKSLNQF
tara:strand:+ start:92 stop:1153 length:1062 start_codon:yes stop_codon:yes gene_type:complete